MYSTKRIINHHKKFLNKHTTIIRSLVIPIVNHKWIKFLVSLRWCWIEPIQILFQPSKQILFKFNLEPFWLIYINFFIYVTKDRSTLQIFVTTKPKITLIQDFFFFFLCRWKDFFKINHSIIYTLYLGHVLFGLKFNPLILDCSLASRQFLQLIGVVLMQRFPFF